MGLNKRLIDQAGEAAAQAGNFDIVLYTGTESAQSITSLSFAPDLVWLKNRDDITWHQVFDTYRGANQAVFPNATTGDFTTTDRFNSFDSNGFTLGSDSAANALNDNFVAWCFKGGGTAVSNTNGTISSSVSANQNLGFSIVYYEGTGSSGSYGHGLSSAPELIITKNVDWDIPDWFVYHKDLATNGYLRFNQSTAEQSASSIWSSAPSSTVVNIGNDSGISRSLNTQISLCFHSVSGVSKVGSYTGTGTTTSFTGFGFQPRWIMIKRTDSTGNWWVFDNERGNNKGLRVNLANAEDTVDADANTYEYRINFLSDGFQYEIDNSTSASPDINVSSGTYIYLAIA